MIWGRICERLDLGVLRRDGRIVNHRSLLKVVLNPWLRWLLRAQIATTFWPANPRRPMDGGRLGGPRLMMCDKRGPMPRRGWLLDPGNPRRPSGCETERTRTLV